MSLPVIDVSQANAKDNASKVGYAMQVADSAGTALGTPDTFKRYPELADHEIDRSWSERKEEYWNTEPYLLGVTKEATSKMIVVSRRKDAIITLPEALYGNMYFHLIELTDEPLNGMYQLLGYICECTNVPTAGKSPRLEFGYRLSYAPSDISLDIKALEADLGDLAITLPIGATLDIAKGWPAGMYEVAWP